MRLMMVPLGAVMGLLLGCDEAPRPGGVPRGSAASAQAQPAMGWDHRAEGAEWTRRSLIAVARHDEALAGAVPADVETFCPAYAKASLPERRAFWAGMMSAIGRYESSWNPGATGGGGRYIGIMQISPKSAANRGCRATSAKALKDGGANLECAADMMAEQVGSDGVVAGPGGTRGVGRDWMPLRNPAKRKAIAGWTSQQSYCQL